MFLILKKEQLTRYLIFTYIKFTLFLPNHKVRYIYIYIYMYIYIFIAISTDQSFKGSYSVHPSFERKSDWYTWYITTLVHSDCVIVIFYL